MTTSTQLAVQDTGGFVALNHTTDEIRAVISDNLEGQQITPQALTRLAVPSGGGTAWEYEHLGNTQRVETVEGILIHKALERTYWPLGLDDEGSGDGPPACSSADSITGIGKPWATRENPEPTEPPEARPCAECPLSQFGSGKNGSQACQQKAQWYMLTAEGFLPIVVTLPPMSLKASRDYLLGLGGAGLRYSAVVTKLRLEKEKRGSNTFSRVVPSLVGKLTDEEAQKARDFGRVLDGLLQPAGAPTNATPGQVAGPGQATVAPPAAARPSVDGEAEEVPAA